MNARTDNNLYVKETSKVSEITDKFGNLRFKVILDDKQLFVGYRVSVFAYGDDVPEEIVVKDFPVLEQAEAFFNDTVDKYVFLIKSEQYKAHDIRIYADRIGYHGVYPACCLMCKWSTPCSKDNCLFVNDNPDLCRKFFCMHPTLFKQRDGRPDEDQVKVRPIVQALCICDAFERGSSQVEEPKRLPVAVQQRIDDDTFEQVMTVVEQDPELVLDLLDGVKDDQFLVDGGTSRE